MSTIPWFKKVYPNIEKVPTPVNQQNGLNMEELLATKPDVVLVADEKQAEAGTRCGADRSSRGLQGS